MIDLLDVEDSLKRDGFAVRDGSLEALNLTTPRYNKWQLLEQREKEIISSLKPMVTADAPKRSLSAIYGLGEQPLHSDGAHLTKPPDVIVLYAAVPSTTPTVVFKLPRQLPRGLRHGVFTVRSNGHSFLAHAHDESGVRYDPGCMSPADHIAKRIQRFFQDARKEAHVHHWATDNQLLFIDNRRALHARNAIMTEAERETRILHRLAFRVEK